MQKAVSFNDVTVFYVKGSAYSIHFWYMSKDDAINMMNNAALIEKMVFYKKKLFFYFLLYIK